MFKDIANEHYSELNDTDIYILEVLLKNIDQIHKMSVDELAKICNTSRATIYRFARKLKFEGYAEMKTFLKWEFNSKIENKTRNYYIDELSNDFKMTVSNINESTVDEIVELIKSSANIFIYGTGQAQGYIALEFQRMFMQINKYINVISAKDELELISANFTEDTILFIVSLSGNIENIKKSINLSKSKKCKIISITRLESNELSRVSNYNLYVTSTDVSIGNGSSHNAFFNYYVVIEHIFRKYLYLYDRN